MSRPVFFLYPVYEALSAFGWLFIGPVPLAERRPSLAGPAPLHPERLCPERPLTPLEHALERQLMG
ncbi:DUF6059 family protein [Streptomyces sp. SAI-229]|uniref:DUF6059 family protein n=1 Tax=Streptomyces sp. SAI-229 TaxID=3377731 RepID=UPI003C7D908D